MSFDPLDISRKYTMKNYGRGSFLKMCERRRQARRNHGHAVAGQPTSVRSHADSEVRIGRLPAASPARVTVVTEPTFESIVNETNLLQVFRELQMTGGRAPGIDGIRYEEVGRTNAAQLARWLSKSIRDQTYRPFGNRVVTIKKSDGVRTRQLELRVLSDRVAAKALQLGLDPFIDQSLLDSCYGGRPGRSVWTLLRDLVNRMQRDGLWTLVVADIRNAYGNVRIPAVMDDHRRLISDPNLLQLIKVVLQGENLRKERGIEQGNAYSPTALNLRLTNALDQPWASGSARRPLHRWIDDMVIPCGSVTEGNELRDQLAETIAGAGFQLKNTSKPVSLGEGETADVLGLSLSKTQSGRQGEVMFGITTRAWNKLTEKLLACHKSEDPPGTAKLVVRGWISIMGPALQRERIVAVTGRVGDEIRAAGFGTFEPGFLERWSIESCSKWEQFLLGNQETPAGGTLPSI